VLLLILLIIDDDFHDKPHQRASRKTKHKDFVDGMHARNGNALVHLLKTLIFLFLHNNNTLLSEVLKPQLSCVNDRGIAMD
jgi:hypothetical protein